MRVGMRPENWEFERTEAARTGSVGVRQAAIMSAIGHVVLGMRNLMKQAQIPHPRVITGPSIINTDG